MRIVLTLSLLALVCSAAAWAQQAAGSGAVSGTVRDQYGEGLPDTAVLLINPSLGLTRSMITTDDGVFYASALTPAPGYRLKATRKGFGNWESDMFQVPLGQAMNFTIDMQVDTANTHVDPYTALSEVDKTLSGVATWVSPQQVTELPIADRRLDALVLLGPFATTRIPSADIVLSGVRSLNAFLTDGMDTTNRYFGTKPFVANQLSPDSVQELQVLPDNAQSEFGHIMGGIINAATRSGSNSYHGTAYGYFRLPSLTAPARYALGQSLLGKENQAGASIGGPIWSNKIFFFGNYEFLNNHFQALNRIANPMIADPTGTRVLASNCTATAAQCAAATRFIQGQMNVAEQFASSERSGLGKIDYRRSDRNTFTFEGNVMNALAPPGVFGGVAANGGLIGLINANEKTRLAKFAWVATPNEKSVNELRLGFFQDRWYDPPSITNGLPNVSLGITVAGATIGDVHNYSSLLSERRYQLVDNFTFSSGAHKVRFGADLSRTWDRLSQINSAGLYTYPSLTNFAQDFSGGTLRSYTTFTQQFGNPGRNLPVREYDLYLQDTWQVGSRLTVTGGVRWDKPKYPQPVVNSAQFFQSFAIASPAVDFAPRVSAAFMLGDNTVVRAGYGWYYAPLPGALLDGLFQADGESLQSITVNPNQAGAPIFAGVLTASTIPSGTLNLMSAVAKLRNPRTQQASIAIEHSLDRDTTLTLNLLDSRGLKFWSATDSNLNPPSKSVTYAIDNTALKSVGSYTTPIYTAKSDGTKAHEYSIANGGSSTFNAISLELRRRMSHGFSVQGSYTWSRALDDLSGPTIAGFVPLNAFDNNLQADRGNSAFDQRHRGVINAIWQPTVSSDTPAAARALLNGWELSSIATLASAEPQTAVVLLNGQQFSTATMLYTSSLNGSGEWNRVPFDSVNTLRAAPQYNVDARLTRTLPFTERIKGVLMIEAFNVLNTQRDTAVNTIAFYAFAAPPAGTINGPFSGSLRPVSGLGAGIASQGFPDGTTARRFQVAFRIVF